MCGRVCLICSIAVQHGVYLFLGGSDGYHFDFIQKQVPFLFSFCFQLSNRFLSNVFADFFIAVVSGF